MAGIKVTDLPSLTTAESNDILYIVETSTNTSKKIEVQNLPSATFQNVIESGNTYTSADGGNIVFNNNLDIPIGQIYNIADEQLVFLSYNIPLGIETSYNAVGIIADSNSLKLFRKENGTIASNYNTYIGTDFGGINSDAPNSTADSSYGFIANRSRLRNSITQIEYLCTDDSLGAAVWVAISTASGSFTTADSKIVSVVNGIITSIV